MVHYLWFLDRGSRKTRNKALTQSRCGCVWIGMGWGSSGGENGGLSNLSLILIYLSRVKGWFWGDTWWLWREGFLLVLILPNLIRRCPPLSPSLSLSLHCVVFILCADLMILCSYSVNNTYTVPYLVCFFSLKGFRLDGYCNFVWFLSLSLSWEWWFLLHTIFIMEFTTL